MFTGIVQATARVLAKTKEKLTIEKPWGFAGRRSGLRSGLRKGSSVSVSGACLTLVAQDQASMTFDVVPETWRRTNFRQLRVGDRVNVERAVPASGRMDGHVVQGHVEGTANVVSVKKEGRGKRITLALPGALAKFVWEKGSVTLDGVSLTVASKKGARISVALIPHTLERTTLGLLKKGDRVNVETDIIERSVRAMFGF
jgi:riboflavin synthase